MARVYAVIMAGGRGERFWPLSTNEVPKPFIPLLGPKTLLQETVSRLQPLIPVEQVFVSIGEPHERIAREQLSQVPAQNFIIEPVGRDTSACLGYSALHLERLDPDSVMLALPADHHIENPEALRLALLKGINNLSGATLIVFGIKPSRPDTGYGYVQAEKPIVPTDTWPVIRFVEKPDADTAARYLEMGSFFWNSGIFLWSCRDLLALFQKHMPDTYQTLCRLRPLLGRIDAAAERRNLFSGLHRISIDFGILEKASGIRLIPYDFGWDDIGNWASLARVIAADDKENVARGAHFALDSRGCITYSDAGTVAVFGVKDLVVVQAHGKVLVCPKEQASNLKRLVSTLADTGAAKGVKTADEV